MAGTGIQLAKSFFSKTPDESVAVKDVYDAKDSGAVNSYQDSLLNSQEIKEKFSILSQYAGEAKAKLIKAFDIKNGLTIDKDSVVGRISAGLSDSASRAKALMKEMNEKKASMMAFYTENKNKVTGLIRDANAIYTKVGNAYTAVSQVNLTDLRSVTRAINAMGAAGGGIGLSTDSVLGDMYSSLVTEAAELGIPDAFNTIADTIQHSQEIYNKGQAIYRLASDTLPNALSRGDIRMAANIAQYIGDDSVRMMRPDAVRRISENNVGYGSTDRMSVQYRDYDTKYRALEPQWDTAVWQPSDPVAIASPVRDVSAVLYGSEHTKDVFVRGGLQSPNPEDKIFVITSRIGVRDVDSEISRQFPYSTALGQTSTIGLDTSRF